MRTQSLSVFLNVAKTGSISEAAREEHLSQPAVSAIVASLESEFGVRLLQREMRQRKPITLTPEGFVFKQYAQQFLELYNKMQVELARSDMPQEEFSIGSGRSNSVFMLPTLIELYKKEYPAARIRMSTYNNSYQLHDKIMARECDLGFTVFEPAEPGFVAQKIMYDPFVFVCPADMKVNSTITVHQFSKLPLIIRETSCTAYELLVKKLSQKGLNLSDMNVVRQVYDNAAVRQAVGMGMGCGFVTKSLISNTKMHDPGCKVVVIKDFELERSLYLVRRNDMPFSPAIKAFWDFTCATEWYRDILPYASLK